VLLLVTLVIVVREKALNIVSSKSVKKKRGSGMGA
jgi:hypothetical protein